MFHVMAFILHPNWYSVFAIFWGYSSRRFWFKTLISRVIVNKNVISIYQNLSLDASNQKQVNFLKLPLWLLFNGSLNTLRFFTHPAQDRNLLKFCLWYDRNRRNMDEIFFEFRFFKKERGKGERRVWKPVGKMEKDGTSHLPYLKNNVWNGVFSFTIFPERRFLFISTLP